MRRTQEKGGIQLGVRKFDRLAYADDVDLMGVFLPLLAESADEFAAATAKVSLIIDHSKTELMKG